MEAGDVFADDLEGGGPPVGDIGFGVTEDGDVVDESIHPDVHGLAVVAGYGDAPGELFGGAGDGDVGHVGEEIEEFLFAKFRDDAHFVGFDGGFDAVFEVGGAQIIIFFAEFDVGFLVVWAGAVVGVVIGLSDEAFAAFAVPTFISAFVDERGEFLPDGLATADVVWTGGADEICVLHAEAVDEILEFGGVLVDELLGGDVLGGGGFEDFVAVFVGAGLEADFDVL